MRLNLTDIFSIKIKFVAANEKDKLDKNNGL